MYETSQQLTTFQGEKHMSSLDDAQLGQVLAATIADQQAQSNAQHQKNIANINDLWSEKERNSALKNQNSAIEKQNSILAGRANRAENELQETKEKLTTAKQALVAHTLATDEAFKDFMMEFYESYSDKEERAKNDLVKFKYRTQQILEKTGNIPTKPGPKNIQYYKSCAYDDRQILQLNADDFNLLITIHQSMEFWKNQHIDYFPDVALSISLMLKHKKPEPRHIKSYCDYAHNDNKIKQLGAEDLLTRQSNSG